MTTNYFLNFMTKDEFDKEAKASMETLKNISLATYPIKIQLKNTFFKKPFDII